MLIKNLFYTGIILLLTTFLASCGESTEEAVSSNTSDIPTATVGFLNSNIEIQSGSVMEIDVVMSDSPISEGGGVTIKYNPDLMRVNKVTVDEDTWDFVNKLGSIDNENGVVTSILVSSYKGVSGETVIATIEIEAKNSGIGKISLEQSEDNPFASGGKKMAVNFIESEINIQAIN